MTKSTNSGGTGHCLCGAVRYRYEGEPVTIGLCQCDRCQRQSGSAFLIGVIFPRDAVTIEGKLTTFETRLDGKNRLWRHFCPTCGSAVSITLDRYPEIRSMMGGTLDDKTKINPRFSVWCSAGQHGLECLTELPALTITRKVRLVGRTSLVDVTSHDDTPKPHGGRLPGPWRSPWTLPIARHTAGPEGRRRGSRPRGQMVSGVTWTQCVTTR